jgi:hypothetical protein
VTVGLHNRPALDVPYYVRGLALGLPAYLIGVHLWTWVFFGATFVGGRADFRQLYVAGYMVRTGQSHLLYDTVYQLRFQNQLVSEGAIPLPFVRPAYEAILFAPLSLASFRTAYFLMLGINLGLLFLVFRWMLPRLSHLGALYSWLPAALVLGYLPFAAALLQGQDSILLTLLLIGVQSALEGERDLVAGILLGLALFKFQIILPIALLFLFWRRWRFVCGFAVSAAAVTGISVALVGINQAMAYPKAIFHLGYPLPLSHMPNMRGLVSALAAGANVRTITAVVAVLSAGFLLIASRRRSAGDALFFATATACVVSFYLLIHDLSVLFVPIVITLDRFLTTEGTHDVAGKRAFRAAALLYVAPLLFSYSPSHFYLVSVAILLFIATMLGRTIPDQPASTPAH